MKKRLYDNLIKIIKKGEFYDYECFRETYWLNYKCDEEHDIEVFRDDIIDYAEDLQISFHDDFDETEGCNLSFELSDNVLKANYKSMIDWVDCGGLCGFEDEFNFKFKNIDFKNFINFSHKNFSPDNFLLNIEFHIKFPFADLRLDNYSLKYKIDDLTIDIANDDLKHEIINICKETLAENNYTTLYPVYSNKFEILIEVSNNNLVYCREFYNYQSFKVIPEP